MLRLGPFELLLRIARGGMGAVWRARHVETGVPVAVKVVTAKAARNPAGMASFRNEARAMARLDHPGIATVLDYGTISADLASAGPELVAGSPYLVMEYAGGGSLREQKGRPTWPQLRGVLVALLDALAHAHARGVIHRDLKASNVLIARHSDARPGLKLADFGIAHAFSDFDDRVDRTETAAGTLHYMAPEQIAGHWREYGPWTDLYSLGCLTHRLVTGRMPFRGLRGTELIEAHVWARPPRIPDDAPVPPGFADWVGRLLQKAPRDRFTRAADAAWALLALPEGPGGTSELEELPIPVDMPFDIEDATSPTLILPIPAPSGRGRSADLAAHTRVPALPKTWRRPVATPLPMTLHGAGLGLFPLRTVPLVGREAELAAMWGELARVHRDRLARAVVLTGPSGIGKSRLATWLAERAHELGAATVLTVHHTRAGERTGGLADMVAAHLRCQGLEGEELDEQMITALGEADEAEVATIARFLSPDETRTSGERYALTERALRQIVASSCGRGRSGPGRPIVLVLDDLQWGEDTCRFATWLLHRQAHSALPVLLLIGFRTLQPPSLDGADGPLGPLLAAGASALHLEALTAPEQAELVGGLLGLERALGVQVCGRSGGNPQFALEVVGELVRSDRLKPTERGFALRTPGDLTLPDGLHAVWNRRVDAVLDGMPEGAAEALERAAILGREVDEGVWHETCDDPFATRAGFAGTPGRAALDTRALAQRADLVERLLDARLVEDTDTGIAFVADPLRDCLIRRAQEAGRDREHHRACAAVLRRRGMDEADERLALHLRHGGEGPAAFRALLGAAWLCLDRTDYRPGIALLAEARGLLEELEAPPEDSRWGELLVALSDGMRGVGHGVEALQFASDAVARGRAHGWPSLVEALFQAAQSAVLAQEFELVPVLLEEMLPLAREAGPAVHGRCLFALGCHHSDRGDPARAEALLGRARALFVASGEEVGLAGVDRVRGQDLVGAGRVAEGVALLRRANETYGRLGMRATQCDVLNNLAEAARAGGDLEGAEGLLRQILVLHRDLGTTPDSTLVHLNLGLVQVARQEWLSARLEFEAALRLSQLTGRAPFEAAAWGCLLAPTAALGDWPAFDRAAHQARSALQDTGFAAPDLADMLKRAATLAAEAGQARRSAQARALHRGQAMWLKR